MDKVADDYSIAFCFGQVVRDFHYSRDSEIPPAEAPNAPNRLAELKKLGQANLSALGNAY